MFYKILVTELHSFNLLIYCNYLQFIMLNISLKNLDKLTLNVTHLL